MKATNPYVIQQKHEFDNLWKRFGKELRERTDLVYPEPNNVGGTARFLTTVVRLKGEIPWKISEVQKEFQTLDDSHYYYPLPDLHFTIMDCTSFCSSSQSISLADVEQIREICGGVLADFNGFRITGFGLNVFPTTVFVQLFSETNTIERLRHKLEATLSHHLVRNEYRSLVPQPLLAYTNIIRFMHAGVAKVADLLSSKREMYLGSMFVDTVELVVTDKVLAAPNTTIYSTFSMGRS